VLIICRAMGVSSSAYYAWANRPGQLISAEALRLHRRAKKLFEDSREHLGYRELMKKLRKEGFQVGRCRVPRPMKTLGLAVTQRLAYKVTTKRKHFDAVTPNLLNQNFNPVGINEIWAGDVTYLKYG
jgi:putative transposase